MGEVSRAPGLAKVVVAAAMAAVIVGCAQPPAKPSTVHIAADQVPRPEGTIPAPAVVVPALPPPSPSVRPETYSVVVSNVRVQDLLFALARDAKLNVDIHPTVSGVVTLNAIDQTLQQLLTRIARMIDLRWEMDGNTLIVMPDRPFVRIYQVDYLNIARIVKSTVSTVGGLQQSGSGTAGTSTNDGTKIDISSQNNFWQTLEQNVRDLVVEEDRLRITSQISRQNTASVSTNVSAQGTGQAAGTIGSQALGSGASGSGNQQVQGQSDASGAAASQTARADLASNIFSNPNAGILMVRTTVRVHEKIQEYLDTLMARSKIQVLIEATIAEVQLNNQYQRGIDWTILRNGAFGLLLQQSVTGTSPAGVNSSIFVGDYVSQRFNATLRLLESFGTVKVLSSPKISVLNNQTAVLKVTDSRVYFTMTGTFIPGTNTTPPTSTVTTTPRSVDIGFTMNVTPQISSSDTVLLNLKPLVTRIVGFVNDPNPDLARVGVISRIPEVQSREMESMIRIQSGQIAVMGGLIQDSISDVEDGIPGLSRIPGADLLNHQNRENRKTELIIFIRPVVVRDASVDGDYARFRDLLPGSDFFLKPNPGRDAPAQ